MPAGGNDLKATVRLEGGAAFKKEISDVNSSMKQLDAESKNITATFDGQANSLEALTAKQQNLAQILEQAERKVQAYSDRIQSLKTQQENIAQSTEKYRTELKEAQEALSKMDKGTDAYEKQARAVEDLSRKVALGEQNQARANKEIEKYKTEQTKAETEVAKLNHEIDRNAQYLNEAENSADKCATSIDEYGRANKTAAKESKDLGDVAKVALGNIAADAASKLADAAVDAAKAMVEVGSNFEAAMSQVKAISGASGASLDQMASKAKQLGSTTKFSATEVAEGFKYMSLAGWDTKQMLDAIDGVVNLAAASEMDLGSASDMVTDYLSAFGLAASDAGRMVDEMVYAQSHSNTSTEQLGDAFGNCAANMNAAGQSMETTTAILEAMANQGTKGSEAGTALAAVMRDITQKMKDGAIQIGNTSVAVTDSNGNFRDLVDILADVQSATDGMGTAQKASALSSTFTARSIKAVNQVLNEGTDNIRSYKDALEESDGAAKTAADTMMDNFKGAVTEAQSAAEGLGVAVFEKVSGPLTGIVDVAADAMGAITKALTPPPKSDLEQFLDNVESKIKDTRATIESLGNVDLTVSANVAEIEAYREVLEKATTGEQLSEVEKYQLQTAVEALSDTIPGLAEAYDAETGSINLTTEAMKGLLDVSEKQIKQKAYAEALETAIKAEADAQFAAAQAQSAFDAATKNLDDAIAKLPKDAQAMIEAGDDIATVLQTVRSYEDIPDELATAIGDAQAALVTASEDLEEANKVQEDAAESAETVKTAYENIIGTTVEASDVFKAYAAALKESVDADKQGADGAKIRADAADALDKALQDGIITQEEFNEAISYNNFKDAASGAIKYGQSIDAVVVSENALSKARQLRYKATQAAEHGDTESAAALREQAAMLEAGTLTVDENTNEIVENTEAVEENADAVEGSAETVEEAKSKWQQFSDQIAETKDKTIDYVAGAGTWLEEQAERAKASADAERSALETTRQAYEDNYNSIKNTLSQKLSLWDAFDGGEDVTVEQMLANLQAQNEGIRQYQQEMEEVIAAYGDELGPDLVQTLQSMGTDAANTWHHMWITMQQDNAPELFAQMGQEWTQGLNLSDQIAKYCAGNLTAYQVATGQLGSTKIEWTGLRESVQEMTPELDAAITAAQEAGVAIPDGLAEGLASGETSATSAVEQITSAMQGTFQGLYEIAQQSGAEIPAGLEEGIDGSAEGYQAAINKLTESLSTAGNDAGVAAAEEISSAMEDNKSSVETAAGNTAGAAKKGMDSKKSEFSTSGQTSAQQYSQGITSQKGQATSAGRQLAQAAKSGADGKESEFRSVGQNMAAALAAGIRAGQSQAINAAVNMAVDAYKRAKAAIGQQSPTGIFKDELGKNVPLAFAAGIKKYQASAERAASEMAASTFDAAQFTAVANRMDPQSVQAASVTVDTSPIAQMIGGMSSGVSIVQNFNVTGGEDPAAFVNIVAQELKQELRKL